MPDQKTKTTRPQMIIIPAMPLAVLGLGSLLLVTDSHRLSMIRLSGTPGGINLVGPIVVLIMIGLLIWKRKNLDNLRFQTLLSIAAGILLSFSYIVLFGQSNWVPNEFFYHAFRIVKEICQAFLLFFWIGALQRFGAKSVATVFACSIIVIALLDSLTIFLKTEAALGVLSALPILSLVCLIGFRERLVSYTFSPLHQSDHLLERKQDGGPHRWSILVSTLVISMFCYAVIFGNIYNRWTQIQDGAIISMLIQLGADCGCILAGLLILLLVYFFWNRDSIELYKVFLLPIVILALWISSSYINEGWVFLYLVLLDSAHKLVLFIIMLSPFMVKVGTSRLFPWCLAYLGFTAGKMSSSMLRALTPIIPSAISSIIILGILFASSMLPALLASSRKDEASTQVNTEGTNNGKNEKNTLKLLNAIHVLVERHSLTSREKEVLMLLAKGRTAKYIAETLFISQLTAETHRKNIYAKIQVHTQQELISMVEKVMKEHRLRDTEQYKEDS